MVKFFTIVIGICILLISCQIENLEKTQKIRVAKIQKEKQKQKQKDKVKYKNELKISGDHPLIEDLRLIDNSNAGAITSINKMYNLKDTVTIKQSVLTLKGFAIDRKRQKPPLTAYLEIGDVMTEIHQWVPRTKYVEKSGKKDYLMTGFMKELHTKNLNEGPQKITLYSVGLDKKTYYKTEFDFVINIIK